MLKRPGSWRLYRASPVAGLLACIAAAAVLAGLAHVTVAMTQAGSPDAAGWLPWLIFAAVGGILLYGAMRALTAPPRESIALDECERQLLALAESLPVGVLIVSGTRIHAGNAVARVQLGREADSLVGIAAATLFVDPSVARAVLASDAPCDRTVYLQRADGSRFRAHLGAGTVELGSRHSRLLLVTDLTENDAIGSRLTRQHEELQAMTRRLLTVQEDERTALSRELHDDIGQAITAIKLCAMSLAYEDDEPDKSRRDATVAEIAEIADDTVIKLRNLSLLLRPPQLDALGLEAALRWQAGALFRSSQVRLTMTLSPLPDRPQPAVELACFRIAQEALTNVLRHANAREVTLTLTQTTDPDTLELQVEDDGQGFDAGSSQGLGLVTMRERAQQLGGSLQMETAAGGGTCVRARLPMQFAQAQPDAPL